MAGKGFHSWLSSLFFPGESGTGFDYVHAGVFAADGQQDKPSAVARLMTSEVNTAARWALALLLCHMAASDSAGSVCAALLSGEHGVI